MKRISVATRAFGLAAILGLAVTEHAVADVLGAFLLLCVIASLATAAEQATPARRTIPVLEGIAVGLVLAGTNQVDRPLGVYLIIPVVIASIEGGRRLLVWTLTAETLSLAAIPLLQLNPGGVDPTIDQAMPWLIIAVGIGLLGSMVHRQLVVRDPDDHDRYVEAQRLLHELLDVSRRLSSGLDPVVLSSRLLHECVAWVGEGGGAVLVRTDGGVFETLAKLGDAPVHDAAADPVILRCWTTAHVAHSEPDDVEADATVRTASGRESEGPRSDDLVRWAFPMRVGPRMIGVLILDTTRRLRPRHVEHLQSVLDSRALPMDTALLFDEIRRLATTEERHRLAREIHDGVAQEIASLGYLVDDLAVVPEEERATRIEDLRGGLTRVIDDLRLSIFELRSEVNRSTGLGLVLSEYLREVGLRSAMAVYLSIDETADRLSPGVEEELLRIVQEAVTNARHHSDADNLWVTCKIQPPGVELVVDDDGRGFTGSREGGYGLSIMRERAERVGASFSITRRPGGGTRISVTVTGLDGVTPPQFDEITAGWREQALSQCAKETSHG